MGDGREGRIVAVWASVGDGVYGEDVGVVEALVLVWVESRGVCRIKEIWGEGKERKRDFLFLSEDLWGMGEQWERMG